VFIFDVLYRVQNDRPARRSPADRVQNIESERKVTNFLSRGVTEGCLSVK